MTDPKATRLLYTMILNNKRLKHSHIDLLPHIRVSKRSPDTFVVSRPGKLANMGLGGEIPDVLMEGEGDDEDDDEMEE